MEFTRVASVAELEQGKMDAVNVNGKPVLLVNLNGAFYAIGNVCTHMGCPLSGGTLKGENVECICHGSTFNVKTGRVVRGPAEKSESKYEVKVKDGQVFVGV